MACSQIPLSLSWTPTSFKIGMLQNIEWSTKNVKQENAKSYIMVKRPNAVNFLELQNMKCKKVGDNHFLRGLLRDVE